MNDDINGNKKKSSQEQREDLLRILKARFELNMSRHKGLQFSEVQAKLEANPEKLWSLNEMEKLVVNRMLLAMIKKRGNIFFMIVPRKVLRAAEVFVTTLKGWSQENSINRKIARLRWLETWALGF
jgi:hypothetical protein